MNYIYEIKNVGEDLMILEHTSSGVNKWNLLTLIDKDSDFIEFNTITEYDNVTHEHVENWHLDSLKANNFKNFEGDAKLKHLAQSYLRAREWALKNHPELML